MSEPDSANNTPLEARQVGTTAQLECFYRRLKKARQAHSQAVHGIRKDLKKARKQKNSHAMAELRRQLQETLADTGEIDRLQAEYEAYRETVPEDQLKTFDYKHRAFWRRWYFWVAVVIVVVLSVAIGGTGNGTSTNSSSSNMASTPQKEEFDDKDYVGKTFQEAYDKLKVENKLGNIYIDNDMDGRVDRTEQVLDDTKAGMDYRVTAASANYDSSMLKIESVDLNVDTKTHIDSVAKQEANEQAGRDSFNAIYQACNSYGEQQFPYGYDPHWVTGTIQEPIRQDDGSFYTKLRADVSNAFGAKREATVECFTQGDKDSQTVTGFNVY